MAALVVGATVVLGLVVAGFVVRSREVTDVDWAYDQLAGVVDAAYEQDHVERCNRAAEVVQALALFDRAATASLTHLTIVSLADAAFPRAVRDEVAQARSTFAGHLIELAPTPEQREIQAQLGGPGDARSACLQRSAPPEVDRVADPTAADVDELRTALRAIGVDEVPAANIAGIRAAVMGVAPAVIDAAGARREPRPPADVDADAVVDELASADRALAEAVALLEIEMTPQRVLDTASLLGDYAFAGEAVVGEVIVVEGVEIVELPSVVTPLVTPEPELLEAVDEIPEEVGPPPPGPSGDSVPVVTEPSGTGSASPTNRPTEPTTRPGGSTTPPGTTPPATPRPTEPTIDPTTEPPTTDPPETADPETTDPEEPTTDEPTEPPDPTEDPVTEDPTTEEPAPDAPPGEDEEECLVDLLGLLCL